MELLRAENLSIEVYGKVIVREVDLVVSKGEVLYVVVLTAPVRQRY